MWLQFRPNQNVPTVFRPGFPPLHGDVSPGSCLNKAFNKLNLLTLGEEKLFTWRSTQRTSPSSFTHKPQLVCSSRNEIIVNYMIMYCHSPSIPFFTAKPQRARFVCLWGAGIFRRRRLFFSRSRARTFAKTHRKRGSKIKIKLIHFSATPPASGNGGSGTQPPPPEFFRDCSGWWPKGSE